MPGDLRDARHCLGRFATGVTVVTCRGDGQPHGATVNAFTSVSLDPLLVLVSLDRRSAACRHLADAPFAVNVLAADDLPLALHFAGRPDCPARVRWADGDDPPRLAASLAVFECEPWASYDGGDHVLFVGRVTRWEHASREPGPQEMAPLVFYGGAFHHLGAPVEGSPWLECLDCPAGTGWTGHRAAAAARPWADLSEATPWGTRGSHEGAWR